MFYVPTSDTYAMYYLSETDPRGAMGLGGKDEIAVGTMDTYITAIDYNTGNIVWKFTCEVRGHAGTTGFTDEIDRLAGIQTGKGLAGGI